MKLTESNALVTQPSGRIFPVPWDLRDLLIAIIVAAVGILALNAFVLGADLALHGALRENRGALAIFLAAQDGIVVSTAWLFSAVRYRVGWNRLGLCKFSMPLGCALSAGLLIASYVVRLFYGLAAYALGFHLSQQEVLMRLETQGIGFLLTLFVAAVVAPMAEEIFFRGFLYGGLRGRIGIRRAMIVSALFFTALHLSLELFLPIFVLGLFLAWLYEQTGSLYPGILLHAANNALSLLLLFLLQAAGFTPS
jgi:membrane protease YdiL (CAAX protease family)